MRCITNNRKGVSYEISLQRKDIHKKGWVFSADKTKEYPLTVGKTYEVQFTPSTNGHSDRILIFTDNGWIFYGENAFELLNLFEPQKA
jgi:hypothetical protein